MVQIKDDQMNIMQRTYEKLRQYLNHLKILSKMHRSKVYRAAQRLEDLPKEFKGIIYELAKH